MLFRNGDFAALIAVAGYALGARYGMEGLPAAMPTLILGVNQTIMMALSMLVIAALVGTSEPVQMVFIMLSLGKTGAGIMPGLAVQEMSEKWFKHPSDVSSLRSNDRSRLLIRTRISGASHVTFSINPES